MAKNNTKGKHKINPLQSSPASKKKIPPQTTKTDWQFRALAALLLVITFLLFVPSLSLHFVNWDDPDNLLENKTLQAFSYGWSWDAVKAIFTTDVIGNYNPLPILTFGIEKYFFAPDPVKAPFIFHFDNLWMHLLCTLFVYMLFTKMKLSRIAAFIGALLFGIHPMRVESVAWITERKDVLYGMFFLAALVTYTTCLQSERSKTKWYVLTILFSLFAYFAKVQAVTLPLSMLALDFYFKRKWRSPKILVFEKLPWWILSLSFGLINVYFLGHAKSIGSENKEVNFGFIDRLAIGTYSYATYLIKWIYPFKMSPLYPYPPKLPVEAYISFAVVPIALIVFLIWSIRNKKRDLLFGWAFFSFNVMFLLQIVGAGQGFIADRFTYIAYIGLFFIMVKGFDLLVINKPSYKKPLLATAGIYLLLFAFLTNRQIKIWEDGGTLWEHVKRYYPNSPLAWKNAGNYYRDEKKDFVKALENYNKAIALQPTNAYVYNSVAKIYLDQAFSLDPQSVGFNAKQQSLVQLAIQNYNSSINRDSIDGRPDHKQTGEVLVNRGAAYAFSGDAVNAIADLTRGLEFYPDNANGYLNRSLLYYQKGQFDLSLKDHEEYIKLNPYNPDMFYEMGLCKIELNRPAEAIPDIDKAIALKNTQPLFYLGRAKALRMTGNIAASIKDAKQAQQMGLNVPQEFFK